MVAQIESRNYRMTVDDIAPRDQNLLADFLTDLANLSAGLANLAIGLNNKYQTPIAGIMESIRMFGIISAFWMKDLQSLIDDVDELHEIAGDFFLNAVGDHSLRDVMHWWYSGIYSISELSEIYKAILFIRQDKKCNGCREKMPLHALQWDHVIARSENGTDRIVNMQLLCSWCNSVKGRRSMEYLRRRVKEKKIRNENIVKDVERAMRSQKKAATLAGGL